MKKIVVFAMVVAGLSIFNACQKSDELIDTSVDELTMKVSNPDVYSKNGYLVFQSVEVLDSIANIMNQNSDEQQMVWEKSLQFESSRTYRTKLNEEISSAQDYSEFLTKSNKAAELGYYNKKDSSMCYPFSIYSWASVLNKDGIVGIDEHLYSFDKNGQIIIYNGTPELIKMAREGKELPADIKITQYTNLLKSVILSDYGNYNRQEKMEGSKNRLRVYLHYNVIKVKKVVPGPGGIGLINVTVPDAVKIDLYCHQEYKGTLGWRDSKTHLYHRWRRMNIGGNYVSEKNFTYGLINLTNSSPSSIIATSNDLSNHFLKLYWSLYPFDLIENQPAPPYSPQITLVDFDIWTGKVGSSTDYMRYLVN